MAIAYLAKDGKTRLNKAQWEELRQLPHETIVREYDNGVIYVKVEWVGKVENYGAVFPDFYKVVRLDVYNYSSEGKRVPDANLTGQWFPNANKAVQVYEEFLSKWSNSHMSADGETFVEEDNSLKLPEPPNPDAPTTEVQVSDLGDAAW